MTATSKYVIDNHGNEHALPGPFTSVPAIVHANGASGKFWFSQKTLAFFDSVIVYEIFEGRIFISSEVPPESRRVYTIRVAGDDSDIHTLGELGQYRTEKLARKAVAEIIANAPTKAVAEQQS